VTGPTPRYADCRCGHNKLSHEVESAPACVHEDCGCVQYVARTTPERFVPTAVAAAPSAASAEQLIAAGKRSDAKRTVTLAEKIEEQLRDLRHRIVAERQLAEERAKREAEITAAKQRVAELERQLAAARAVLKGNAPPKPPAAGLPGDLICPECGRPSASQRGHAIHRAHAHGVRKGA
jgi:hypothetical protein